MDKTNSILFINKAIQRTKSKELKWSLLPSNYKIKPLATEDNFETTVNFFRSQDLLIEHSYYAPYKQGNLLLLVYPETHSSFVYYPPNDCNLSLRMQDSHGKYSVEIAFSTHDIDIKSTLIRLYNLIDKDSSSVNTLIDDFLNS